MTEVYAKEIEMQITFPACQCIEKSEFTSQKGTRCGVLRWYDQLEGKIYRTMVFGDDCGKLAGLEPSMACSVVMNVTPRRRDDTIELYLERVDAPQQQV